MSTAAAGNHAVPPSLVAPYVTRWSAEEDLPYDLVEHYGRGIGYADEHLVDRDERGVLWARVSSRHRVGRPEFGRVHPLRQRRAMRRLLCQVCAGPADTNEQGTLWLMLDYREDWPDWPENMGEPEPPICVPCVQKSVRLCPALRKSRTLVRVKDCPIVGVRGAVYFSGQSEILAEGGDVIRYSDPRIRWARAVGLVRELRRCQIIPMDELID